MQGINEDLIDFEKEVEEFTKFGYVQKIEIIAKGSESCEMIFTTLENYKIHLKCSTAKGIEVQNDSLPLLKQTRFEAFDTMLGVYSPQYKQKFSNDLFAKLQELADRQSKEE